MTALAGVRAFVRQTLGCNCPDSVFERVLCEGGVQRGGLRLERRILVGDRLLIYVLRAASPEEAQQAVHALLQSGREERERVGLNRLRLVLVSPDPMGLVGHAQRAFADCPGRDERTHLHVVGQEALGGLCGSS
jgi:hypothetical protein